MLKGRLDNEKWQRLMKAYLRRIVSLLLDLQERPSSIIDRNEVSALLGTQCESDESAAIKFLRLGLNQSFGIERPVQFKRS